MRSRDEVSRGNQELISLDEFKNATKTVSSVEDRPIKIND